jgi:hypothetical protein
LALENNFSDYDLFSTDNGNLLIVASNDGHVPPLNASGFAHPELRALLHRIGVTSLADLEMRRIGDRASLEPLFDSLRVPMNSDYFPILDQGAARTRFLRNDAIELLSIGNDTIPILEMLDPTTPRYDATRTTAMPHLARAEHARIATAVRNALITGQIPRDGALDPTLQRHLLTVQRLARNCGADPAPTLWLDSLYNLFSALMPYVRGPEMVKLWRTFYESDCYRRLSPLQRDAIHVFDAVGRRDARDMAARAEKLLIAETDSPFEQRRFLLTAGMLGYVSQNKPKQALALWNTHAAKVLGSRPPTLSLRLLLAHSVGRSATQ